VTRLDIICPVLLPATAATPAPCTPAAVAAAAAAAAAAQDAGTGTGRVGQTHLTARVTDRTDLQQADRPY